MNSTQMVPIDKFFALIAALALVCTAVSCQKEGGHGVYGCSTSGESTTELRELANEMHSAVKNAVGSVSEWSSANDSKAQNAAQAVVDARAKVYNPEGTIILYFAPSTQIGEPDAEKVVLKTWKF